jgi:hypothetical protein
VADRDLVVENAGAERRQDLAACLGPDGAKGACRTDDGDGLVAQRVRRNRP